MPYNTRETRPMCMIAKQFKNKGDNKRILKAVKNTRYFTFKEARERLSADFSTETIQDRK